MNAEKLDKLRSQVRIGGKGTARRKKKVVHRNASTDDKKLQSSLKKLNVNLIPGIEEVKMFKDDGSVLNFTNPKVQAALSLNTYAVTGTAENKTISSSDLPQEIPLKKEDNDIYKDVPEVESFDTTETPATEVKTETK